MREKLNEDKSTMDEYGYKPFEAAKKRLDLNDLLDRAKVEKKTQRKNNILIFSAAASAVVVFYLVLSL